MKLNNKVLALLLVFIAVLSISAVSAEDVADNSTVIEASVDADDVVLATTHEIDANATVSDIEDIIANTSSGDTLSFAENATYDFGNTTGILIPHTLILQGNGATIKGYNGFLFEADEESIDGTQVYNLNFIMTQDILWNGRALDFEGGRDYVIANCSFNNGNSGVYIKGSKGNVTIRDNYFYADEGATNKSTITGNFAKQEIGAKAINLMGGNGIKITNNIFEGDYLDAVSIASKASNVEMYDNFASCVWYGVFYGGGITNITMVGNTFEGSKAFALGIIKAAGNSNINNNTFTTPEGKAAIYIQEGNTAHGDPSIIETIIITENAFYGEDSIAVTSSSQGGMISPKGMLVINSNIYEDGVTVFSFTDNNTYTFTTDNFISETNRIYINDNIVLTPVNVILPENGTELSPNDMLNIIVIGEDNCILPDVPLFINITANGTEALALFEGTNDQGIISIPLSAFENGEYEVYVYYEYPYAGTNGYYAGPTQNQSTITIKTGKSNPEAKINITEDTVDMKLAADATGYLLVDVAGIGYYVPVENGEAIFYIPDLLPGNYTVDVTYTGDNKYDSASASGDITIRDTIISEDLEKIEKSPDRFEAKFTDVKGNALANTTVSFILNGVTYNRTTDANGTAGMNINLIAGTYEIAIMNPVTGEVKINTITVLPRIVDNNNLVKYFRNASQFTVKVLDDEGNPAKAGEKVTFNINGAIYTRETNSTGEVKLSINLNPGNYVITTSYKNCVAANNVTVLPTLTASDLTKKYGEPGAFEATLVDGQGKALANTEVTFNINGVLYKRSTNDTGVAKLNINLVAGEYIITTMANDAVISNKVTVTA